MINKKKRILHKMQFQSNDKVQGQQNQEGRIPAPYPGNVTASYSS